MHQEKVQKNTRKKIWKLHEDSVKSDFSSYVNKYRNVSHVDASVQVYSDVLKASLLEAIDRRSCGLTKGPARLRETWWSYNVGKSDSKEWK